MKYAINTKCFPIALTSPFETTTIAKLLHSLFLHHAKWPFGAGGAGRVQFHFVVRPVAISKTAYHEDIPEYHHRKMKMQP